MQGVFHRRPCRNVILRLMIDAIYRFIALLTFYPGEAVITSIRINGNCRIQV